MSRLRACILWQMVHNVFCIELTLKIENLALVGGSSRLECKYDLQGEQLYSVKWYKDGDEFYRLVLQPEESPEVLAFEVGGVYIDEKQSTAESVVLRSLELASSGQYRCEVTADSPTFQIVSKQSQLTVVLPDGGPHITGSQDRYEPEGTFGVSYSPRRCTNKNAVILTLTFFIILNYLCKI